MITSNEPHVAALYRYPVKGLSPEQLDIVDLSPGATIQGDRVYAIERHPGKFDPHTPRHLPKVNFIMLMRDERLAALETRFIDTSDTLTLRHNGTVVAEGQLSTAEGRAEIETFLSRYMGSEISNAPRIVSAKGHSFSDVPDKCVHIVNHASIRTLESELGREIDPIRFRPNIVVDGIAPWRELDLLEKTITIAGVKLQAFARTQRCAATNVDPSTGQRDMSIPELLQQTVGHRDFGIYARVLTPATIRPGDHVELPES